MRRVVIDRIRGRRRFSGGPGFLAGVQVSIEAREVAAADFQP